MFDVHAIKGSTTVIDDTDTSEILSKNKTSFNLKIKFKYTVFINNSYRILRFHNSVRLLYLDLDLK